MTDREQAARTADRRGVGEPTSDDYTWVPTAPDDEPGPGGAWAAWARFAAVILLIAGLGHVLLGIAAVFDAGNLAEGESDPALQNGYSAWGWIHLVGGGVLLAAGSALLARRTWGRVVAIAFAVLNAVGALGFLSTAPAWGLVLIAMDVVVLYALTVHWDERARTPAA